MGSAAVFLTEGPWAGYRYDAAARTLERAEETYRRLTSWVVTCKSLDAPWGGGLSWVAYDAAICDPQRVFSWGPPREAIFFVCGQEGEHDGLSIASGLCSDWLRRRDAEDREANDRRARAAGLPRMRNMWAFGGAGQRNVVYDPDAIRGDAWKLGPGMPGVLADFATRAEADAWWRAQIDEAERRAAA